MIKPDELLIKLKQQVQDNIISELPKIEGVEYQSNCHGMSYGCLNLLDIIIRIPNCSSDTKKWDPASMSPCTIKEDQEKRYTVLMKYRDYALTTTCPPTRNFQTPQFYISGNEIKNLPEEITRLVTKWRAYEKGIQKLFTKEIYDKEKAIWDKLMIEVPKMGKKVKRYMPGLEHWLDTNHNCVQQTFAVAIQIDNSDICVQMPPVDWEAKSNLIGQPINKIDLRVIKMGKFLFKAIRPSNFTKKLKELLKQQ